MNHLKFALITLLMVSLSANAQQQNQAQNGAGSQQGNNNAQPASGIGISAADVVMPATEDVVEETIQALEKSTLTPEQFERLKKINLSINQQKATPYIEAAKAVIRTLPIDLNPGIEPPIIRLSQGINSSIVFSDISGDPWFIEHVDLNRSLFSDGKKADQPVTNAPPTNIVNLEPLQTSSYGNVVIKLKGLSTPVIFVLTAGQKEVDMRVDAKVPGNNPDATSRISTSNMPSIDSSVTPFLDGVPPATARKLKTTGLAGVDAWVYNKNMYVRTNANVEYPAYLSSARSTAGLGVYKFAGYKPAITLTTGGQAITVFIDREGVSVNE